MANEVSETASGNSSAGKNNHDRIEHLLRFLNSGLYGKEEAVRLALLSALAGESIFFLGPPGTAKSMISRRIKDAFKDETAYFEYLLNEFSTPDEICGPVSLQGLENDKYERVTKSYLPEANVAFLDEIWKAGPAILNTLLSVVNERKFHNGSIIQDVPLKSLVTASNELPQENRGLEALWDRLIVRVPVNPVQNEEDFFNAVTKPSRQLKADEAMGKNQFTLDELAKWQEAIDRIDIPESVRNVITAIRQELVVKNKEDDRPEKEKYYVSDRRWKKIVRLLRTSAFFNDRIEVDLMDCQIIQYCIWNTEKQREESSQTVEKIAHEYGLECNTAIDDINDQIDELDKRVADTWYKVQPPQPEICTAPDGTTCYKTYDANKNVFYFAANPQDNAASARHYFFDANWSHKTLAQSVVITSDEKTLQCNHGVFSIAYAKSSSLVRKEELFGSAEAYEATKNKFDSEYYAPISESITSELKELEQERKKCEKPFYSNLFAEKQFAEAILLKMESAKKELENAKVALDKVQARYKKD